MNLYFDTSALVKYYYKEPGTEKVTELIQNITNEITISEIAIIEFVSSLHKKHRMKELDNEKLQVAITEFKESLSDFIMEPFTSRIREEAEVIVKRYGKTYSIKTLDAIQLATYNLIAEVESKFVCADDNLIRIAELYGHETINPNN